MLLERTAQGFARAPDGGRAAEKEQKTKRRRGKGRSQASKRGSWRILNLACEGGADFVDQPGVAFAIEHLVVDQGARHGILARLEIASQRFKQHAQGCPEDVAPLPRDQRGVKRSEGFLGARPRLDLHAAHLDQK